jgi:hypothetical protein
MTVYELINGGWVNVGVVTRANRANFVIVCDYGDWSGFRTLDACLRQIPEAWRERRPGFYRIEER